MEHLQPFLDWAIDASNDPAIRTLVVAVVPGLVTLSGLYLLRRWLRGRGIASEIDGFAKQNQQSAEKSKLARASLESGDTKAARALLKELSQLHQEAATLIEQARPIATLLKKRLGYLNKSDAEMAELIRELVK